MINSASEANSLKLNFALKIDMLCYLNFRIGLRQHIKPPIFIWLSTEKNSNAVVGIGVFCFL